MSEKLIKIVWLYTNTVSNAPMYSRGRSERGKGDT